MKTIILAGGRGTRLTEETTLKPKPLVQIGNHPMLWHIMKIYSFYNAREFVIALGYMGELIREYFLNYKFNNSDFTVNLSTGDIKLHNSHTDNWIVHLLDTGEDTQTGGRIRRAMQFIGKSRVLAAYGDSVANINIHELIKFHEQHGKLATLTAVRPPARFGGLNLRDKKVIEFSEKPLAGEGWINGGFFVLEPEVIDYIEGDSTPFEFAPLENLAKDGQLMAYKHEHFWQPMDVIREKQILEKLWNSGDAPWKIW